ncbi:hypothetical protein [Mesonia aestuariivivens]|uniref:Lipoprotein n=1 Tax=Mesonia aestuariivivens TaxID=2796128 RepID=A0ABS6W292_9FLAO|nr:hypothetical protein [Mesonia aestuariivivens]MBW2961244.1 hypothetical protein [Mesonia aestuariivivens]
MKKLALITLSLSFFWSCSSQTEKATSSKNYEDITGKSPQGNWEVHKEFDEQGNLIREDSTYSYSWSSVNGQQVNPQEMDSLMGNARKMMQAHMNSFNSSGFENSFDDDFFGESMMNMNPEEIRNQMMKRMEQMRSQFFDHQNFSKEDEESKNIKEKSNQQSSENSAYTTSTQQI